MRLVFFSSDRLEVQRVSLALMAAGIPCEVRKDLGIQGQFAPLPEAEVWIRKNADLNRAFMVCIEQSIGFAKRETDLSKDDYYDFPVAA